MRRPYLLCPLLAGFFLLAPFSARAFETVDTLPYASGGRFYAYPPDEIRPYELYGEAGLMHDTNILRQSANAEIDKVSRFGIGGRLDQRVVGRQSVQLEARGDQYLFDRFSELNHFAYSGSANWLWEVGNDWTGTIGYARTHRLASLTETQRAIRRMVTTDDITGTAAWRVGPSFRLRGLAGYGRGVRDTPGEDRVTLGTRTFTAGADYVTALGNSLGIEHRESRGDAPVSTTLDPNNTFGNNDFKERETAVVASYISGATLRFNARVGRTTRTYTDLPNSFSGTTYRGGLEWVTTPKTLIALEVYKEPRAIIDIVASHSLVHGVAFGPAWAPTAKLAFSLRFVNEHREFIAADPNVAPAGTLLDETVRVARFGIAWEPQRQLQVGLGLDRGDRQSNTLGRNYAYTAAMFNVRVIW